ncbi:MAG: TonB-dependent receptor plug domain-containing protein [Sulfuricellaceae bacterium]|nr:TonB-dependent receptor plug domain-containing protein [Sulfuricellaceae bacterium]
MMFTPKPIALALAWALPAAASLAGDALAADIPVATLPDVIVRAVKTDVGQPAGAILVDEAGLARATVSGDTADLLGGLPGVSLYGAGGVSSLPAIHGLADDRLRIKVDGMDLISACANHMNPPLSYIDPSNVGSVKVFAGIVPVSVGGDSLGGTIEASSPAPEFAAAGQGTLLKGRAGTFYRSNGDAKGGNVSATAASEQFSMTYRGSSVAAGNYSAANAFKPSGLAAGTSRWLAGDEVGSSAYQSENQSLAFALRHERHLLELRLGLQHIPYQGFPDQRMDMTDNRSEQANLHYTGQYRWGALEARVYNENTRHKMNFLEDKLQISNPAGMPMDTEGKNAGMQVKADIVFSERDIFRVGSEYQRYRLNDWWDPISTVVAMPQQGMKGGAFWNIDEGQRDRFDVFGEWEARWNSRWLSQFGVRSGTVSMNTGEVRGYNTINYPAATYAAFNAADRGKTDRNLDLTALARYTPDTERSFEFGLARKTRSPNLYERYAWSANNTMVMNMVNWFGDGNGYVGNIDLKPEVAHTLSATADWHDAAGEKWGLKATPYYTYVQDYIDAVPCAAVGKTCPARTDGFVNLSFANQNARLYGLDVSGSFPLAKSRDYGSFTASGALSYVRGKNLSTGDNLYNIMPLNAKLAVVNRLGGWTGTVEAQFVDAKTDVAQVRNELKTAGYGLLNLRGRYEWKKLRFDVGIENALNRFYNPPLSGAYVGQGNGMSTGILHGTPVPGAGRSIYTGLSVKF